MPQRRSATANKLWIVRKRSGYLQKWVASLLGQRSLSLVSEYEKGLKLPSLRTALKLEIIYRTPLEQLFPDLYGEVAREVQHARQHHAPICRRDHEVAQELAKHLEATALEPQLSPAISPSLSSPICHQSIHPASSPSRPGHVTSVLQS